MSKHLRSPDGKVEKTMGTRLAEYYEQQGWKETPAPPKKPRCRAKRKGYYYTDSAHRG